MPAIAKTQRAPGIHPLARAHIAATTDSRCRRTPLARTKREIALAAHAELPPELRPMPLLEQVAAVIGIAPETLRKALGLIWPFAFHIGFWVAVCAPFLWGR